MQRSLSVAVFTTLASVLAGAATANPTGLLETTGPTPLTATVDPSGRIDITPTTGPALKHCRPYLASRVAGTTEWREEFSHYQIISQSNARQVLTAEFPESKAKATVTLERDAAGRLQLSGKIDSSSDQALEIARFHYLDGLLPTPETHLLSMRHYELPGRIIKPTESLKAPLKSNWGWTRLNDPIHSRENIGISGDSGVLGTDWTSSGFFFGFTTPGSAFGELGMRTREKEPTFFLAVLLDGIRVAPGKSRVLEAAVIAHGDTQQELRQWIGRCAKLLDPARVGPPLAGYCSWYQVGQGVKPAHIRRAIESFRKFEKPPGGHTIQIDDGFQVMPGDWTGRGEWKDELDKLPKEIRDNGFIPGIWVAPTAIHETHPIVKAHPDWLQRNAKGEFCITFHNWKTFNGSQNGKTYFLEPDHPEARKFIRKTLQDLRSKGWDYFKIDFAYTVSSDRAKYDPTKTTYESLRDQWKLFREALGEDAIINSCNGGMWRYTIGAMDVSRIGGDIGGSMKHLRRNLAEMMLRAHANGVWFQADPDVFYMRDEKSDLTFEQSHLLTGTQGLLGTAFLTSDFADQWSPAATALVKRYWNQSGPRVPRMQHISLKPDGLPAGLAVAYGNGEYAVGLYNWNETPLDVSISLKDLRLPEDRKFTVNSSSLEKVTLADGKLTVHQQPGESLRIINLQTQPARLLIDSAAQTPHDSWGFNAEIGGSVCGIQTFDAFAPGLYPPDDLALRWSTDALQAVRDKVASVRARGLQSFVSTDLFVLPKALVAKYRAELCDAKGRLDIHRPKMQEVFRAMLAETLDKVPDLDGIVIRTGEVYLHKYPHHAASGDVSEDKRQGGSAILRGPESHIEILKILREEVCVKRGKKIIYRTWSFGPKDFHESPDYYLKVTNAIEPHPNLIFSVKHQQGDFHQLTPFNPTLMIGKHRQIIEVQSQREAYGKGAHPYYIGSGVIDGWEEYAWMMKPGEPKGLRDVMSNPLYAGLWTWSRGGGWEGPFIKSGLWCELNTYVVSQFAAHPELTEKQIFQNFARNELKLSDPDAAKFHELCLLSAKAVLRGQLTTLGAKIDVWWARDHFFEEPDLSDFVKRGLAGKALAEKADAVAMWREIERLASEIHFADPELSEFVKTSAAYGRIKYAIVEQAWTIFFTGKAGEKSGTYDREKLTAAIACYDALWNEWHELKLNHPSCATIYKDVGFEGRPGMGAGVNRFRKLISEASTR